MKKSRIVWLALAVLLVSTLACAIPGTGGGGGGGGGGGTSGGTSLTVINSTSSTTICYVYISPTTESTWGDDWLGATEVISPGDRRTFDGITPGDYDLRADDCSHNSLAERRGEHLEGSSEWTISD